MIEKLRMKGLELPVLSAKLALDVGRGWDKSCGTGGGLSKGRTSMRGWQKKALCGRICVRILYFFNSVFFAFAVVDPRPRLRTTGFNVSPALFGRGFCTTLISDVFFGLLFEDGPFLSRSALCFVFVPELVVFFDVGKDFDF